MQKCAIFKREDDFIGGAESLLALLDLRPHSSAVWNLNGSDFLHFQRSLE